MFDLEAHDDVTVLRMAYGKANTMDVEFCQGLVARLRELEADSCRAVVLTGLGRMFSAGVDLRRVLRDGTPYLQQFLPALSLAFTTLARFPKPLVSAVNGHAIAGGCVMACATDRCLMAKVGGRIGVPELLVGVPFPAIALEIMRAAAGADFSRLLYSGETLDSEKAYAAGLVHEVVAPEQLIQRAVETARRYGKVRADAFALTKEQVRKPMFDRIDRLAAEESLVTSMWLSSDTLSVIERYVESTLKKPG